MTLANWISPLDAIDEATSVRGPVRAALLTTFDVPDAELLVEDLLPRWLGLHRVPSADESAQRQFLAELVAELDRLHGAIHVISSPPRQEDARPHRLCGQDRRERPVGRSLLPLWSTDAPRERREASDSASS